MSDPNYTPEELRWRPWEHCSASTLQLYDTERESTLACHRRFGLEKVFGVKPPEQSYLTTGSDLHAKIENYYKTGEKPDDPLLVPGMPYWPPRNDKILIEDWFTLQVKDWPDNRRVKIIPETGWPMGKGRWTGKADLLDLSGTRPVIVDFKNLASFSYAKKPDELAGSVQLTSYAKYALQLMPSASEVVLKHVVNLTKTKIKCPVCGSNCSYDLRAWLNDEQIPCRSPNGCLHIFQKSTHKGKVNGPDAREVRAEVSAEHVSSEWARTESIVHRMRILSEQRDVESYPKNPQACFAYGGCPHQVRCWGRELRRGEDPTAVKTETPTQIAVDFTNMELDPIEVIAEDLPMSTTDTAYMTVKKTAAGEYPSAQAISVILKGEEPTHPDIAPFKNDVMRMIAVARKNAIEEIVQKMGQDIPQAALGVLKATGAWAKIASDDLKAEMAHPRTEEVIEYLKAKLAPKPATAPAQQQAPAKTGLCLYIDVIPMKGVDAVVSGAVLCAPHKAAIEAQTKAPHYTMIDYGAGAGAAAALAREEIRALYSRGMLHLRLDTSDRVQCLLAQDLEAEALAVFRSAR